MGWHCDPQAAIAANDSTIFKHQRGVLMDDWPDTVGQVISCLSGATVHRFRILASARSVFTHVSLGHNDVAGCRPFPVRVMYVHVRDIDCMWVGGNLCVCGSILLGVGYLLGCRINIYFCTLLLVLDSVQPSSHNITYSHDCPLVCALLQSQVQGRSTHHRDR